MTATTQELMELLTACGGGTEIHRSEWPLVETLGAQGKAVWLSGKRCDMRRAALAQTTPEREAEKSLRQKIFDCLSFSEPKTSITVAKELGMEEIPKHYIVTVILGQLEKNKLKNRAIRSVNLETKKAQWLKQSNYIPPVRMACVVCDNDAVLAVAFTEKKAEREIENQKQKAREQMGLRCQDQKAIGEHMSRFFFHIHAVPLIS